MSFDDQFDTPFDEIDELLDGIPQNIRHGFPELIIRHEGNKTIIQNFGAILTNIRREASQIRKFVSSRIGVRTKFSHGQLELYKIIRNEELSAVFDDYAEKYISCPNCGKPDTIITTEKGNKKILRCLACGTETKL